MVSKCLIWKDHTWEWSCLERMKCFGGMEGEFNKYLAVLTNEITYVKSFEKKLKMLTMQGELKRNTYHIVVLFS